jgi:ribose transport system permease protein
MLALAGTAGLGVGLGIGAVNGLFVTLLRLPSFLVTLASLSIVAGLARTITDLQSVAVANDDFIGVFGSGDVGPIPGLAFWGSARSRSVSSPSAIRASARMWSRPATT